MIKTAKEMAKDCGNGYYQVVIFAPHKCPECGKRMIDIPPGQEHKIIRGYDIRKQLEEVGLVQMSYSENMVGKAICIDCAKAGKASFKCNLCEQVYPTSEIQESFGMPADYLCKYCYNTVSAKKWDEKVKELEEHHLYDFE